MQEASRTQAWGQYEAEYLKNILTDPKRKYETSGLDDTSKQIYLDRVTKGYQSEADESLKREFELWLLGKHQANFDPGYYTNPTGEPGDAKEGAPVRRHTFRGQSVKDGKEMIPGEARDDWRHTPWGTSTLLHLPGVRDYFRNQYERSQANDIQMQLLADHGPQDIESAWTYFKHWVKQRPLSESQPLAYEGPNAQTPIQANDISPAGGIMPPSMHHSSYNHQRSDGSGGDAAIQTPVGKVPLPFVGMLPQLDCDKPAPQSTELQDRTHLNTVPSRMRPKQQDEAGEVRQKLARLESEQQNATSEWEADSLQSQIRTAKAEELIASQEDVAANAERRAATLREEGNNEEADAVLRSAQRITERLDVLRRHRLQERKESRNAEVPSLPH